MACRMSNHVVMILLTIFFVFYGQNLALSQLIPGTIAKADSDLHFPIAVTSDNLMLKTGDGTVFATLQNLSAELVIMKGATVQIRRQGGFLNNLEWCNGQAKLRESFGIEGFTIEREITYYDGSPRVTKCIVNGIPSDGIVKLSNSISIDLKDPKHAPMMKPRSDLSGGEYLPYFAFVALIIGGILFFAAKRYHRNAKSNNQMQNK